MAIMRRSLPGIWGSGEMPRVATGRSGRSLRRSSLGISSTLAARCLGGTPDWFTTRLGSGRASALLRPSRCYVVGKDAGKNVLVVGPRSELGVREVRAGDVNLISVAELDKPMRVTAKTHYRQRAQAAEAVMEGDQLVVRFDEAVARPAAGQSLVFYDGDAVVGGGTIETSE